MKARSLSANTLALVFSSGGSAILGFLLTVLIGRGMGETGLGVYAAVLAWIFPFSLGAEFGISTLLTREIAQTPASAALYWQTALQARLLMGGSLMLSIGLLAPLLSNDPALVAGLRLSAPLVLILPLFSTLSAIFRAHQVMLPIAALNIGMLLAQVALTALVLALGGTLHTVFLVNTLTSVGQLVAAWVWVRYRFPHVLVGVKHASPDAAPLRMITLLKQGYPFAIAAILAAVQLRVNVLILEQLSGAAQVGYYAAAFKFIEAARLLPMAFFDALFPRLAALAQNPARLQHTFRRLTFALWGYGVLVGIVFMAFAPLLPLVFGEKFSPAIIVLQIGGWSLLPLLLKQGRTLYWYAVGHEQHVNRVTLGVIVVQVLFALWLIPAGQAAGAALVAIGIETSAALLLWLPIAPLHHNPRKQYQS